jgi:ABC-type sugar transport system permease subunit
VATASGIPRVLLLVPCATLPIVAFVIWRWLLDPRLGEINQLLLLLGSSSARWRSCRRRRGSGRRWSRS